ncbi:CidA/LrgA family protein [Fluviibacterium sp. DFM31]|uniref:CidA/LrgA family protein n=1 Tax=Meridianimarinicoccus marinus TaxID=3231483 RepID=A0ABV3L715_9RHOB
MIHALAILLSCQLAGEVTARAIGVPVPGPVLGMIFLTILLLTIPQLGRIVQDLAQGLLNHLSLLFVPAGVGVVAHLDRLGPDGPALLAALVVSTVAGLSAGALAFAGMLKLLRNTDEAPHAGN